MMTRPGKAELAGAIEPVEKAAAKERQLSTLKQGKESRGGNLPQREKGKSRDKVAKATGKKARTLAKASQTAVYVRSIALAHRPTDPRRFGISGRPVYPGRVSHMLLVPPARPVCQMSTLPIDHNVCAARCRATYCARG